MTIFGQKVHPLFYFAACFALFASLLPIFSTTTNLILAGVVTHSSMSRA